MVAKKMEIKILLVDNIEDDRKHFIQNLQEINPLAVCIPVKDGEDALAILTDIQKTLPQYIFLDIKTPKITAQDCLKIIRNTDNLKKIPVVVYTTSQKENNDESELF